MSDKRIVVWIQKFNDRPQLMLQWTDPVTNKRKTKSAGTDDPAAAEHARGDLEADLNNGRYNGAVSISWEKFRERFEEEYAAGTRQSTQKCFQATLDHFEKLCNPRSLKAINERTVSAFAAGLRKQRVSKDKTTAASTIKVRLQFLHTVLNWAAGQKLIPAVPEFPAVKVLKKDPQPVPLESFERLLAKAPDQETRAFLLCGWLAGLRLTEALYLEREPTDKAAYLDLARDRIVLPAEIVKATKDQWVPLDPELRSALEQLPRHGRKVFRFIGPKGQLTPFGMSGRVIELARQAGVKLTMKSLRRGFGCRYAAKVSAHVLQRLMRHANIKTTMDYYANIDDAVEQAVLGAKRNTLRNTTAPRQPAEAAELDRTLYEDGE